MGLKSSKHTQKHITDYTKVTIPPNYLLLKISSYNINIKNTINLSNKVKNILIFIVSTFKEKSSDIICLQGINDYKAANELVKEIKKYMGIYNTNFYFAPEFDNINVSSNNNKLSINKSTSKPHSHLSKNTEQDRNSHVQNIIISKYPIISSIFGTLSKNLIDDITTIKTVIGANISINNNVISIYCTELSDNLEAADIDNRFIREKELEELNTIIQNNITKILSTPEFVNLNKTDVHFVIGTLYINDINTFNEEYQNMLQTFKFIDIFRCLHNYDTDIGYTCISNKRIDYIFLYLTDDIYDKNSVYYNDIQNIDSTPKLLNLLFKRYKIHFLESGVRTDISYNYSSNNHPIETIIMFKSVN